MRQRLFVLLAGIVAYAFVGYPLLLLFVSAVRSRPIKKGDCQPSVSLIIPAYNEVDVLPRKLESVLAQDYPREKLEIIVASDGSTDGTNDLAERYADRGVRLLALERGGKAQTLNRAVAQARHEILVFSDANAILDRGALRALMTDFADPTVGGVSADERREDWATAGAAGLGERLYWEYDKWLKRAESRIGSMVSASGSLYAIRRSAFRPITDPAATDDFTISTQAVRAGYRLVFEPEAITFEPAVAKGEIEFGRKVRIVTRGLRSVYGVRDLLLPWRTGFYAVEVVSHKVVRRLIGICAVGILGVSLSLVRRPFYRLVLAIQVAFYLLALVGWRAQGSRWGRKPWFYVPYYFCLSNIAATIGVFRFLSQRRTVIWQPRRDT